MRTSTITMSSGNTYKITLPEFVCFSQNYNSLTIQKTSGSASKSYLLIKIGSKEIKAYIKGSIFTVCINSLLRSLFSDIGSSRTSGENIYIKENGDTSYKIVCYFVVVNGNIDIDQRFAFYGKESNDNESFIRHLTWFVNFPFRYSLFEIEDYTILEYENGVQTGSRQADDNDIFDYDLSKSDYNGKAKLIVEKDLGEEVSGQFDGTYNNPFHTRSPYSTYLYLEPCDRTEGLYLRWIDNRGLWYCYLFDKGVTKYETDFSSEKKELIQTINGYQHVVENPISLSRTKMITCCATSLTDEKFRDISTIINSLYVEMYVNGSFQRVKIDTKSIEKTGKRALNDIEIDVLIFEEEFSV